MKALAKDRQSRVLSRNATLPASALVGVPGAIWPQLEKLPHG